ncbi:ABC-2 type transport system ATP-binding protein [bacterium A37T11]|nr:ABC-2 type transport system ATP-binding protein [bacterium A37T11]
MIKVDNLTKKYNSQSVLKGISFECTKGRILGFLGPNGAGKSTTMRILTGYLPPDGGSVLIGGLDIIKNGLVARKQIGYLPESNPLYPGMYIKEALGFVADLYNVSPREKRVDEVIGLTGLGPEQHKQIKDLSKGYRQRVGLAQAIIHDPAILILDEPTSGLDPNQLQDIRALITRLGKDKTIILSTHIMQEVEAVCEDVVIIHHGNIVANFAMEKMSETFNIERLEDVFIQLTTESASKFE